MRRYNNIKRLFSQDRKALYIVLGVLVILVSTLTIVYAALSTTLNINGQSEVSSASWDIHLDNVQLNSNSATTTVPTIANSTTATFTTTLSKTGDFYEFTIDVVNDGSIDAMIDGVTKTPTLTETQAKYLNYIVEYQNGESINTKQLVSKNSFVRLKVKLEFRKDISASDLPQQSETLSLSFRINYVQSDGSNENISINNNGKLIKVVSGDYDTIGSEICIGEECFYVISSDETSVTMLAKYNLYVGKMVDENWNTINIENPTGIQNSIAIGYNQTLPYIGTIKFSNENYWYDNEMQQIKNDYNSDYVIYPYVYDNNSDIYKHIENYKKYLENKGIIIKEARLIKTHELESLGCTRPNPTCENAPSWVYATSYWTGSNYGDINMWCVGSVGNYGIYIYDRETEYGVRPVITIPKS